MEKKITKKIETTIVVYEKDPKRCHPNCPYCNKDDNYQCEKYHVCIDTGEDTPDMYGFERTPECIKTFGE